MKIQDMLRVAQELGDVETEPPEDLWDKIKAGLVDIVPSVDLWASEIARKRLAAKGGSMIQERSREVQIKAILGRFSGDRTKAMDYCMRVAELHPKLRAEYLMYKQTIEWEHQQ